MVFFSLLGMVGISLFEENHRRVRSCRAPATGIENSSHTTDKQTHVRNDLIRAYG
jgi:hypothetical protein